MAEFPSGQLLIGTFPRLSLAHAAASKLAAELTFVRLLDIGIIPGTSWVCAWAPEEKSADLTSANKLGFKAVSVSEATINAMFSLGPALPANTADIGILEIDKPDFIEFFKDVEAAIAKGWTVLEIRVRKAGFPGAHAFFAKGKQSEIPEGMPNGMTVIPLVGDYRRFFT